MEKDLVLLDYKKCLGIDKNKKYDLSQPIWWNSAFTDRDLFRLMGGTKTPEKTFSSLFEIEDFILQWFGRLYSIERPMDIAKIFGVEYYTPYMDKEVINITRKIPVELKKALNYHKYIFYHIASQRLPECIIKRKKGGLDLNLNYFRSKKEIIDTLVVDYLDDRSLKIYMYISYNMVKYIIKTFRNNFEAAFQKIWLLLNLSIWLEENGNICD
jgi:asparagine synthetase B (glutamine-hydrolysing)